MPINATPEFFKAKADFENEKDPKKKIEKLKYLLSVAPSHKGAEKLLMQLKKKLAQLKEEAVKKKKGGSSYGVSVKKEGAAQVVIVGMPGCGKSTLLSLLTNARPEISPVPFTTKLPEVASMHYLNVGIQLVELPAIVPGGSENSKWLSIARTADLVVLLVDSTQPEQLQKLQQMLDEEGINNPTMVIYSKGDLSRKPKALNPSDKMLVEGLRTEIWKKLDLIRVYTKIRFAEPDLSRPVTLPKGSTVNDLALHVHRDFAQNLKHARIWRGNFKGLKAGADYELKDGDVVELVI